VRGRGKDGGLVGFACDDGRIMSTAQRISVITRRDLFDHMSLERLHWSGRLDEPDFCARVWPDIKKMRSNDPRFPNGYADIYQHRVNNYDWEDD
jgi:hypothetical protein